MSIASTTQLTELLRQHRLLTSEQDEQLPSLNVNRYGDARELARFLCRKGWLTVYQINQIVSGKVRDLCIGPYRVLEKLGEGGLSQVFKARHTDFELVVALKVIKPEVLTSAEGRQQFLLEVEAMARLDHPNIAQFCDADQDGELCYFAMEYLEGIDLGKHVRLSGPLPVAEACEYVRQTALGLQHAHERNLVHRDVKPVNLFLTHAPDDIPGLVRGKRGHRLVPAKKVPLVKILDWGLASPRRPGGGGDPGLLNDISRGLVGTADYLSPEQARNANTVDIRGDIYSLGCTLYYLLTGQPPFPDGTLMQKIIRHQMNEFEPVESFRDDIPAGLSAVLRRMTAKKPDDRYRTPAAVAVALGPYTQAATPAAAPAVAAAPARPVPAANVEDTPLPAALAAGSPGRLPRAGIVHAATNDDTSA